MSDLKKFSNWVLDKDSESIYWLKIDCANKTVNSLNQEVLEELVEILNDIQRVQPRGLIVYSGKSSGFIAGADIEQLGQLTDVNEAIELVREGQKIFSRLADLPFPTVAMIEGFCLGGGVELALACRYRVAENSKATRLGFPEIKLGIHPGWLGTLRLPQISGAVAAMDLLLSGRTVSADIAQKMGFIDAAVPLRHLKRAARHYILAMEHTHQPSLLQKLSNMQPFRYMLAAYLQYKVSSKVKKEHYPAPYAIIANWQQYGAKGEEAVIAEAHSIGRLLVSDTCKNLVRVFYLQEQLKNQVKPLAGDSLRVHVVGAGTMGGDIAAWCALQGLQVTLQDREPKYIAPAISRAYRLFKMKLKTPRQIEDAMDRLVPDHKGLGINKADIIIEAIFEKKEVKQALFKELENKAKPEALLATNTSTIPLQEISQVLNDKSRLVGIHFFNPVSLMPLIEVVEDELSSPLVIEKASAFVRRIDRLPLIVKSSPGFLVNRILMPYLLEAMKLVEEGLSMTAIDKAAVEFGMPLGPLELADVVGLDVCLFAAQSLSNYYEVTVPAKLLKKVEKGELGKKTGKGFYYYKNNKPLKEKLAKTYQLTDDLMDRLLIRMLNEAGRCLREGVVDTQDQVDAGMIFGAGFPPFRGGLMHYAASNGVLQLHEKAEKLQQHYGERFKLDNFWQKDTMSSDL